MVVQWVVVKDCMKDELMVFELAYWKVDLWVVFEESRGV